MAWVLIISSLKFNNCKVLTCFKLTKILLMFREAFKLGSTWRTMDASQRGNLINKLADLIGGCNLYFTYSSSWLAPKQLFKISRNTLYLNEIILNILRNSQQNLRQIFATIKLFWQSSCKTCFFRKNYIIDEKTYITFWTDEGWGLNEEGWGTVQRQEGLG